MSDIFTDLSIWPGGPEFFTIHEGGFNGRCIAQVTKGNSNMSDTEFTKVTRTLRSALRKLEEEDE